MTLVQNFIYYLLLLGRPMTQQIEYIFFKILMDFGISKKSVKIMKMTLPDSHKK
jgi:hypothetical protein